MDERRLSDLFSEAVADVEPADRLAEIRLRTSSQQSRVGWYAVAGAALAAAAAVTTIALLGNQSTPSADERGPAQRPTEGSGTPMPSATPVPGDGPVAVYYVGDTPSGPRLFRYFEPLRGEPDHGTAAELGLLTSDPSDPDYRTLWPRGAFRGAVSDPEGGEVLVTLGDAALRDRPASMSEREAQLAIEQVVYTMQAAFQEPLAVRFRFNGNPIDRVLGVPTSEPLANAPQLDVLSLVNISDPSEGRVVADSFTASGRASSFEGTVLWEIRDSTGAVVDEGFAQADGYLNRLYPWTTEIDVSKLDPDTYTFVAMTSDPSDGEGLGPYTDTRTIVVE